MKTLALGVAALFALAAAAPPTVRPSSFPGRYPTATGVDLGSAQLISEVDPGATLAGVQIFVAAGLDRQSTQNSGVAALVADCISRTPVSVDVAGPRALRVSDATSPADTAAVPELPGLAAADAEIAEASGVATPPAEAASAAPAAAPSAAPSSLPSGTPSAPASPAPSAAPSSAPFGGITVIGRVRSMPTLRPALPAQNVPAGMLPVRDAIAAKGGTLTYTVDGRSAHFYIEGTPQELPELVALFGKALATPDFSPATINVARASLISRANDLEANALSVGIEMFRRSYYATGAALPALGTTGSLANLTGDAVRQFYTTYYRRGAFFASAVGNSTQATTDALKALASALPDGTPAPTVAKSVPIPASAPRIVARRDVAEPMVVVGFGAPSPGSRDFGAMLVLESLLSDAFERDSATTLPLSERSVGAFYLYDSSPASLVVYVNGGRIDPSLAMREVLTVAKSLSLKPLSAKALAHFKAAAEGEFITDSVSLSDRSYLLGTFANQGLGNDSINAALAALDKTSSLDIQRVAKNYLQRYIVALVLPRSQGSDGS